MLARRRFNRFNLVFAHQTNYLAPPYPFWLDIPEFPQIRVPGLSDDDRKRNLEMLQYISEAAADHGIDFTLGVWEHNIQTNMQPTVEGITRENIGPYSRAALKVAQQRRGLSLNENDLWIAATALAIGATLVTRDSDFKNIETLAVLTP